MNKKTKIAMGAAFALIASAPVLKKQRDKKQSDHTRKKGIYETTFKRPLDIACALGAMTVFSPLYLGTALAVKIKLGSPVIFTQERPGKDEKIFKLYKFRTMTDERDEKGNLLPDDVRLTKFGRLLRSTSFDELPEAWNILKGDMSVVGPRPLLVEYLPRYNEHQARRHEVRPGLTGYAQVCGRNGISWDKKFELDIYYIDHISLFFDIKIVLRTIISALKREGISQEGEATMESFIQYVKNQKM